MVAGAAGARRCPGSAGYRAAGGPDTPAYAALARVADPARRPPAYIEVAQLETFRDEDLAYALRLGQILHRRHEDQTMQAHCHTLVVNACILSTTWYLHNAVDADRAAGHEIGDATIAHLTPARSRAMLETCGSAGEGCTFPVIE